MTTFNNGARIEKQLVPEVCCALTGLNDVNHHKGQRLEMVKRTGQRKGNEVK